MEIHTQYVRAYPKTCIGCKRHEKDIMLSFAEQGKTTTSPITDLFLTQKMAEDLHEELGSMIEFNKKETK